MFHPALRACPVPSSGQRADWWSTARIVDRAGRHKGSPPKRRSVLTVWPWLPEILDQWARVWTNADERTMAPDTSPASAQRAVWGASVRLLIVMQHWPARGWKTVVRSWALSPVTSPSIKARFILQTTSR
jgi:hypothetical protein